MIIKTLNVLLQEKEKYSEASKDCIIKTAIWINEYIAKPNVALPSKRSICPAVKKAMTIDSIHFYLLEEKDIAEYSLRKMTLELERYFFDLPPNDGIYDVFKVVGILISNPEIQKIVDIVNNVQKELKPYYITKGLLLGKFHSLLKTTSINNSNFIPGRSPYPMLVLRYVVEEDKYFLSSSSGDNETKSNLLKSYLKLMENKISSESISLVKEHLDKLK